MVSPTGSPVEPSGSPLKTNVPFVSPTGTPTFEPSESPVKAPTQVPVASPTGSPTREPTTVPSEAPVKAPTRVPVASPTGTPTGEPTSAPMATSTNVPVSSPLIASSFVPADYSERIVLPKMSEPILDTPRTGCPHLETGMLDWHSPGSWPGGSVPGAGVDVTLPPDSRIFIQRSVVGQLGTVTIPSSSALIIGENDDGVTLDIEGLDVRGELTVGAETCRITKPVTITLHGTRSSDVVTRVPEPVVKGISVTGTLNLHGKRYFRTWTRLALTVNPGDRRLYLQHPVNWESGQEIVVVTTAMKDSREWHQNEKFVVSGLDLNVPSGVGAVVLLASPVEYMHVANLGYQAEVGLLSRTITVQGSISDSLPTDPDSLNCQSSYSRFGDRGAPCPYKELTGYGGHVMVHTGGKGFVEGVRLFRMGQTNVLGRYPMHFHRLENNCPGCYFRESSIESSFYRCISVHATNGITVAENVAFNVTGHCYYLEDGVEVNNKLSFNLAALIHSIGPEPPNGGGQHTNPSTFVQNDRLTLPADVTAAGFYITNMQNEIVGNAASGVSCLRCLLIQSAHRLC